MENISSVEPTCETKYMNHLLSTRLSETKRKTITKNTIIVNNTKL